MDKKDKLIYDVIEKFKRDEEIKKELTSDESYFTWLADFTKRNNGGFADDNWLYHPEQISDEDKEKVEKLHLFYEVLSDYATRHYIREEIPSQFYGSAVLIKFHGSAYKIGYLSGQGTFFYCEEVDNKVNMDLAFSFNDVLKEKNEDKNKNEDENGKEPS